MADLLRYPFKGTRDVLAGYRMVGRNAVAVLNDMVFPDAPVTTPVSGSIAGRLRLTGSATASGASSSSASASGRLRLTRGLTTATVRVAGVGAGRLTLRGAAAAAVFVSATATGRVRLSGAAAATVRVASSATGVLRFAGAAAGGTPLVAAGAGAVRFTGTATAVVTDPVVLTPIPVTGLINGAGVIEGWTGGGVSFGVVRRDSVYGFFLLDSITTLATSKILACPRPEPTALAECPRPAPTAFEAHPRPETH